MSYACTVCPGCVSGFTPDQVREFEMINGINYRIALETQQAYDALDKDARRAIIAEYKASKSKMTANSIIEAKKDKLERERLEIAQRNCISKMLDDQKRQKFPTMKSIEEKKVEEDSRMAEELARQYATEDARIEADRAYAKSL